MEKITVSYIPKWDSDGTVYRCNISMSEKVFDAFSDVLLAEKAMEKEHVQKIWINTPINNMENVFFLNLTQAELLKKWLSRLADVDVNRKRLFYNANTSITIK